MVKDVRLSDHFRLHEFLESETAQRSRVLTQRQFSPPAEVVANLTYLTTVCLERARCTLGWYITISSGYRCPELNSAVGGSETSQHLVGQAADCYVAPGFEKAPRTQAFRDKVGMRVREHTGMELRDDTSNNFYLFAFLALSINTFDVDQVIHEYGPAPGSPAWIHVAVSPGSAGKREVKVAGRYVPGGIKELTIEEALSLGTAKPAL